MAGRHKVVLASPGALGYPPDTLFLFARSGHGLLVFNRKPCGGGEYRVDLGRHKDWARNTFHVDIDQIFFWEDRSAPERSAFDFGFVDLCGSAAG